MTFLLVAEKMIIMDIKGGEAGGPSNPTPPNGSENSWEKTLNELDTPKKSDISIGTVTERLKRFQADYSRRESSQRTGWHPTDVRELIKNDIDFEEPVIRGPVEVAKGNDPILALNHEQMEAVGTIFDFSFRDVTMNDYYVLLESSGKDPKRIEARLKYANIRPPTQNHLVVSATVAKELDMEAQKKDIRILSVHQKVEDVDLDKI